MEILTLYQLAQVLALVLEQLQGRLVTTPVLSWVQDDSHPCALHLLRDGTREIDDPDQDLYLHHEDLQMSHLIDQTI